MALAARRQADPTPVEGPDGNIVAAFDRARLDGPAMLDAFAARYPNHPLAAEPGDGADGCAIGKAQSRRPGETRDLMTNSLATMGSRKNFLRCGRKSKRITEDYVDTVTPPATSRYRKLSPKGRRSPPRPRARRSRAPGKTSVHRVAGDGDPTLGGDEATEGPEAGDELGGGEGREVCEARDPGALERPQDETRPDPGQAVEVASRAGARGPSPSGSGPPRGAGKTGARRARRAGPRAAAAGRRSASGGSPRAPPRPRRAPPARVPRTPARDQHRIRAADPAASRGGAAGRGARRGARAGGCAQRGAWRAFAAAPPGWRCRG